MFASEELADLSKCYQASGLKWYMVNGLEVKGVTPFP